MVKGLKMIFLSDKEIQDWIVNNFTGNLDDIFRDVKVLIAMNDEKSNRNIDNIVTEFANDITRDIHDLEDIVEMRKVVNQHLYDILDKVRK